MRAKRESLQQVGFEFHFQTFLAAAGWKEQIETANTLGILHTLMKTYFGALSLMAALLVGCNKNELSQKLDQADRVVLSGPGAELTVTGDKAREIINIVASAKRRESRAPSSIRMFITADFYRGTNFLGGIEIGGGTIYANWRLGKPLEHGFAFYSVNRAKMESLIEEPLRIAAEEKESHK